MNFWNRKRVLVTGGSGFLGSHLVEALTARGCRQIFVARSQDFDLVEGEAVRRLYAQACPELVIHLAARAGGIGANLAEPARFFYDNLLMGLQMIEVGRQVGIKKFVAIGTTCCYPACTPLPLKEEHLWNGYPADATAPYGLAKRMLLVQAQTYRKQYGFNAIFLMPTNLYGPRDNFEVDRSHVIAALIRRFVAAVQHKEAEVAVWGSGRATREFLYVIDAAEGILLAAEKYNESDPINLGTGVEVSVRTLAETVAGLTGFRGKIVWDTSRPEGQPRRWLDVSKARERFGFQAKVSLEEGLRKTIDWYAKQTSGKTVARGVCL